MPQVSDIEGEIDLWTKEGIEYAVKNNLFTEFCPKMVANAVDILEGIISEK